ncbi:Beta-ketoacyl synthase [Paramyrothecium foliicola]|nr:Beta-ketoacyl synthase [Paramyrothecium foliicola]
MEVITLIQGEEDSCLTPLFLVHAISGVALPFLRLESLSDDDDRPVYGITSPVYCPGGQDFKYPSSLGELAAFYLKEVKEVQPEGPYLLGGWSMGGMVAMFMAQILEARGEEVLKVVMIDSANPEVFPKFSSSQEHRAYSKATYNRTVAFGLQMQGGHSPRAASPATSDLDEDDYILSRPQRKDSWGTSRSSSTSASSSASSLFDDEGIEMSTPMSPLSEYDTDLSDCESDLELDDPPQMKDFLTQMKLHIHEGLGLIAGVSPGDLFTSNEPSDFDVVLVKCAPDSDWDRRQPDDENVLFIRKVMREQHMRWNPRQFRSFTSIPFSGEHDGAFQPQFIGELSSILKECLEDID